MAILDYVSADILKVSAASCMGSEMYIIICVHVHYTVT